MAVFLARGDSRLGCLVASVPTMGAIHGCCIHNGSIFIGRGRRVGKILAIHSPRYRMSGLPLPTSWGGCYNGVVRNNGA